MFITDERVDIAGEDGNIITIRARMNYKQYSRVQSAAVKFELEDNKPSDAMLGEMNLELLKTNIVAWRGPAFDGVPCTEANIDRLDPTEPLIEQVLDEIGARNKRVPTSPNGDSGGATSSTASAKSKR